MLTTIFHFSGRVEQLLVRLLFLLDQTASSRSPSHISWSKSLRRSGAMRRRAKEIAVASSPPAARYLGSTVSLGFEILSKLADFFANLTIQSYVTCCSSQEYHADEKLLDIAIEPKLRLRQKQPI